MQQPRQAVGHAGELTPVQVRDAWRRHGRMLLQELAQSRAGARFVSGFVLFCRQDPRSFLLWHGGGLRVVGWILTLLLVEDELAPDVAEPTNQAYQSAADAEAPDLDEPTADEIDLGL